MTDAAEAARRPRLKRAIGPKLMLFFVIGDMLGTGIYALTGDVAGEVGGAAWLAFGLSFVVALFTATSYMELVGKYPRAAGAALYTQEAFGSHFLTFLVAFAVVSSGVTSGAAASRSFAGYFQEFLALPMLLVALAFVLLLAVVNLRGVAESVKLNVVLTCIEASGLLIVIGVGAAALVSGKGDAANALTFNPGGQPFAQVVSGATLAFFALLGFEDSVNMVEEAEDPQRTVPRALLGGLAITGVTYMLVAFVATALVPIDVLRASNQDLLEVVRIGAPWFPLALFSLIAMFAVSNTALINMMMASRLLYGMAQEQIIPAPFGAVHARRQTPWVALVVTTVLMLGLASWGGVRELGGTTALLLLCVFTLVNAAALVLRGRRVAHAHYRAPLLFPVLGTLSCAYLASPWAGRDPRQYEIAGGLLLIGLALWLVNWLAHGRRAVRFDAHRLGKR